MSCQALIGLALSYVIYIRLDCAGKIKQHVTRQQQHKQQQNKQQKQTTTTTQTTIKQIAKHKQQQNK